MPLKLQTFTEADARQRACPMRLGHPGMSVEHRRCLAAQCMAWRWHLTNINDAPGGDLYPNGETYGFCGLAWPPDVGGRMSK